MWQIGIDIRADEFVQTKTLKDRLWRRKERSNSISAMCRRTEESEATFFQMNLFGKTFSKVYN